MKTEDSTPMEAERTRTEVAIQAAEAVLDDPNARAADKVQAARLLLQVEGALTERNRPGGGGTIVQVTIDPEVLEAANRRIEEATARQKAVHT